MKKAIYPGSFDPVTRGHYDIICRSCKIVDKLIVGVLNNKAKMPLFSVEERVKMLKEVTKDLPNVEIIPFDGLLVDFAEQIGADVVIRGLRAITDFEYELQMSQTNQRMKPDIETMFLTTSIEYSYLSSTTVREIAAFGGDVSQFVPEAVEIALREKMKEKSWFVAESLEEFDRWMRKDQGWLYVAKDCSSGQLAGMFFVVLPGMEEENLGYDIGMQGRQLYECAIMDTVVVLPEYRGMHLQYEMMQHAEADLREMGYKYLLCTVHPENIFSRSNVMKQGYEKMLTKEKYGGFLRDIWMKQIIE